MILLSILIPTYNRSSFLDRLLQQLENQQKLVSAGLIQVVVSDNSSTDQTPLVVDKYRERNKDWIFLRNSLNLGAEANLIALIKRATGTYLWLIGDDDMPRSGLLSLILDLLQKNSPNLIYLPSIWAPNLSTIVLPPLGELQYDFTSGLSIARKIHIQTTFISSWIFNRDKLFSGLATMESIETGLGSYLPQLGWILPLLVAPSSRIIVLENPCILATSGNTGGYSILKVFLANYPRLVYLYTRGNQAIRQALIGPSLKSFMPSLVLEVRQGKTYHQPGDISGVFKTSLPYLWYQPLYWFLCVPALFLPVRMLEMLSFLVKTIKIYIKRLIRYS